MYCRVSENKVSRLAEAPVMANSPLALSYWLKPNTDEKGRAFIRKWIRNGYNTNKNVKK